MGQSIGGAMVLEMIRQYEATQATTEAKRREWTQAQEDARYEPEEEER